MFRETQLAAEMLTLGDENNHLIEEHKDQIIFVVHIISTHVTFIIIKLQVCKKLKCNNRPWT